MSYIIQKPLPSAEEVLRKYPLSDESITRVKKDQQEISDILSGKDARLLLIIGPCSAWPDRAVLEYAKKLKPLSDFVSDKIKIVMRAYIQKPRTTVGWLGPMNQVDPYGEPDIEEGIYYCRKMMREVVEIGLPLADEALFTHNDGYVVDLLSWVAIGARSSEDQEHRIFASMIPHPVGMKNPTSGSIRIAMNSLQAAQHPHVFSLHRQQVQTSGNPHAHLILRGGDKKPNCSLEHLQKAAGLYRDSGLQNPAILVDVSHENSMNEEGVKRWDKQPEIVFDVLESCKKDPEVERLVKGFMMESFLEDGCQKLGDFSSVSELKSGQSVTDGCLGWEKTEKFVKELVERV